MTTMAIAFPKTVEVQRKWIIERARKRLNGVELVLDELIDMELQDNIDDLEDLVEVVIADSFDSDKLQKRKTNKAYLNDPDSSIKTCPVCGIMGTNEKEINDLFYDYKYSKDGKDYYCKKCKKTMSIISGRTRYNDDSSVREKKTKTSRDRYAKCLKMKHCDDVNHVFFNKTCGDCGVTSTNKDEFELLFYYSNKNSKCKNCLTKYQRDYYLKIKKGDTNNAG